MTHKITSLSFILFVAILSSFAQNGVSAKLINQSDEGNTFQAPQYPGGESALNKYVAENIKYPDVLVDIRLEGDLLLNLSIDKSGVVDAVKIIKGFDPDADDEVVAAIRKMPRWIPAKENTEAVNATQNIEITFSLTDELIRKKEERAGDKDSVQVSSPVLEEGIVIDSLANSFEIKNDTLLNKMPQYPGGQDALDAYLKANLKYPKTAVQMKIEGRVIFNVVVEPDGEISKVMLFRGIYRYCDEEAFYLIKKMPKWIPGLKDGKPVAMQTMIAIPFKLPGM